MQKKAYKYLVLVISILIPVLVTILYFLPRVHFLDEKVIKTLPKINAILNATTTVVLILAFFFIKNGHKRMHKLFMLFAVMLSILFLLLYVMYHSSTDPVHYGGEGIWKSIYFFILFTHIVLAVLIVPLVLITLIRGLNNLHPAHKKVARWTLPLWLYVTVTGVWVYILLSPYY